MDENENYYDALDKYYENGGDDKGWGDFDDHNKEIIEQLKQQQIEQAKNLPVEEKKPYVKRVIEKPKRKFDNSKINWTQTMDFEILDPIELKSLGPGHVPIGHGDALEIFRRAIRSKKLVILSEKGLLSHDNLTYVYFADIELYQNPSKKAHDYNFTVGFINSNNRRKSFCGIQGETIIDGDCEMIISDQFSVNHRHSINVYKTLKEKTKSIVDDFLKFRINRLTHITKLKTFEFGDKHVGLVLINLLRVLGPRRKFSNGDLLRIITEWDKPDYVRTAWGFEKCFSEVLKRTDNPIRRITICNEFNKILSKIVTKEIT